MAKQLTAYGRLTAFAYRLERTYRRETDPARRAKILVRLALLRVALAESEPTRAIVVWQQLARTHLEFWDHELDHPEWEFVGTDHFIAAQLGVSPDNVDATDEYKRESLANDHDHERFRGNEHEFLVMP